MPYSDRDTFKIRDRCYRRTKRHPLWRQQYDHADGMCELCGSIFDIEFHHNNGHDTDERMVVCKHCHYHEIHAGAYQEQPRDCHVAEDVQWEIEWCGGIDKWREKYGIVKHS